MTLNHKFGKTFLQCILVLASFFSVSSAHSQLPCGQTIDFNTWTQEGLLSSGTWVVGAGGNSVVQSVNSSATWFVSPNDFIDVLIQGSIQVNTASDDDLVGFMFGYQDPFGPLLTPTNTPMKSYVFDWKQTTQVYQGLTCNEGFALYEIDGPFDFTGTVGNPGALVYPEFWERVNTPIVNVLDTDYGNNGWVDFQQYDFQLKYTADSIVIWIDGSRIFEESGCFEPGRFGFFNQSQNAVSYSNFSYNIEYDFDAADTLICLGDTSFFEIGSGCASSLQPTTSFAWDFDDGNTFNGVDPFHIYASPGTYQAQLVSSDPFGCSDTSIQIVEVLAYPVANAGVDDTVCALTYNLNASPTGGQWSALAGGVFSDASSSTSSVSVPTSGVYEFVWETTNAAGCSDIDTVSITFNELSISAIETNPTCASSGDGEIGITVIGGISPFNYQWDAATGNQMSNPAVNLGGGVFGLTVTDAGSCSIDTTFTLIAPPPISFTLDLLPSDCDVSDGSATISNLTGGVAPFSFNWGAGSIPDNFSLGLAGGNYNLTISDNVGCDSTLSFDILTTPFIVSANVVDISCVGFNDGIAVALGPTPGGTYTYQWGASSNNQTTQTATNLIPGSHTVTITSVNGCMDSVDITILEPTALALSVSDTSVCAGELVSLFANASGGTPAYSFEWENSLGQVQNPTDVTISQTEIYTVTVMDANSCELSDSMMVTVLESPIASFTVNQNESCMVPSFDFNFQNTSSPTGGSVTWDFGDNTTGMGDAVNHSYTNPGTYTVSIEVTSASGCVDTLVETNFINIFPNPTADFSFSPGIISNLNPSVQFIDLSFDDINGWSWNFGDFGTSNEENPLYSFGGSSGSQLVTLEVENIHGCLDTTFNFIEVREQISIYAPNTFTPDGDEFNQTWQMYLEGLDVFDVEINIYNRWGERIWQSFDVDVPWDGTYNGVIVPNGIYTWSLKVGDLNTDEKYERVGHINVLR